MCRKQTLIVMLLSVFACQAFSQDLLPSTMREKVYMFFSDEVDEDTEGDISKHKKSMAYLATYSDDSKFHMIQIGSDEVKSGSYEYKMMSGQRGMPYGVISHEHPDDKAHSMFHVLMIPHDRETGVYFVMGYKMKKHCESSSSAVADSQAKPKFFNHSGSYKRLF